MKTKNNENLEIGCRYCARMHLTFDEKVALYKKHSKSELARMLAQRDEIAEKSGMAINAPLKYDFTATISEDNSWNTK